MSWQSIVNLLFPLYSQLMSGMRIVVAFLVEPFDLIYYLGPFGPAIQLATRPLRTLASLMGFPFDLHQLSIVGIFLGIGFPIYVVVQLWKWVKTIII